MRRRGLTFPTTSWWADAILDYRLEWIKIPIIFLQFLYSHCFLSICVSGSIFIFKAVMVLKCVIETFLYAFKWRKRPQVETRCWNLCLFLDLRLPKAILQTRSFSQNLKRANVIPPLLLRCLLSCLHDKPIEVIAFIDICLLSLLSVADTQLYMAPRNWGTPAVWTWKEETQTSSQKI